MQIDKFEREILDAIYYLQPRATGATIYKRLAARRWFPFLTVSSWRIYLALLRLEWRGLIKSEWEAGPYPRARLYKIHWPSR